MSPRLTNEEFLTRARQVHGDGKFDYSRIQYIDAHAPIEIRCIECDRWFKMSYQGHVLRERGCSKCSGRISRHGSRRMTTEEFVARAVEVHGQKYSYDKTEYKGAKERITISCIKHSDFSQSASDHLSGYGCQKCGTEGRRAVSKAEAERSAAAFVKNANAIHGNGKYDYSRASYENSKSMLEIGCSLHGWYRQRASHHLSGHGCDKCKNLKSTEQFIRDAISVHGNERFDYRDTAHISHDSRVKIYCNKCQRTFSQTPTKHLLGRGCPTCKESKGERAIVVWLNREGLEFERQWTPPGLVYGRRLMYDFLASGTLIEFDGKQHFAPVKMFGGEEELKRTQERDALKNQWAKENNIPLIRISYKEFKKIDSILSEVFVGAKSNGLLALAG